MGIVNKDGAAFYKYLNFNQIEEQMENAKGVTGSSLSPYSGRRTTRLLRGRSFFLCHRVHLVLRPGFWIARVSPGG
jgi:hypothetical protein